jgi:hypothetical protein
VYAIDLEKEGAAAVKNEPTTDRVAHVQRLSRELAFYRLMIAIERAESPDVIPGRRRPWYRYVSFAMHRALMEWKDRYDALRPTREERCAILARG